MLFTRTSRPPKNTAGRRIAWERPVSRSADSTSALPRKYGSGESGDGFVIETWTTRSTPASAAARNRARERWTARANVEAPWSNRTQ